MGWKSSRQITREEAIKAILVAEAKTSHYNDLSNEALKDRMYDLNIGDDPDLPYFGYNFCIVDDETKKDPNF